MSEGKTSLLEQLEQEHMIAHAIASMPSNVEDGPDVTTPPPIRAKWAHRLYQQGIRIHPDLATHGLMNTGVEGKLGSHAPKTFQKVDEDRLLEMVQRQNPKLYARIKKMQSARHQGPKAAENLLARIADQLPHDVLENIEKLTPLVDEFAEQTIPPETPTE